MTRDFPQTRQRRAALSPTASENFTAVSNLPGRPCITTNEGAPDSLWRGTAPGAPPLRLPGP